jgi:subtilase family serine protease
LVPAGSVLPLGGPGQPGGYSPAMISLAYGFNQITFNNGTVKGDGTGQTIAIVDGGDQPNIASDLVTFDAMYGLPAPPSFIKVNQFGGTSYPPPDSSWGMEISLDVEWSHAMAPGASILLVEALNGDWLSAVNYARNQPGVAVVSMSFGSSEFALESTDDSYFTTPAGHSGVTFVAASGDGGSSGAPEYPSVSPNVIAVGGTQLNTDSQGNYQSETGWSGSGGGISSYESQPISQSGVVTQSSTMRTVPDVAYNAANNSPYAIYDSYDFPNFGGWVPVAGTSAGAPQWSALIAIADQGRALAGLSPLDGATQTQPMLYQLASTHYADFHDITGGSNGGYSSGPGYDLVTGIGTPLANLVVPALAGITSQGPSVVTPASAASNPVTGTSTNLSVSGTDPGGASSLTYTWSVTSAPSGAPTPNLSINGNNAAQSTTATFYEAGVYIFQVTLTDPSGLTATSSIGVTVNQTLTSVVVSPGTVTLPDATSQQFSATAEDQFGQPLATQPIFTWTETSGSVGNVAATGLYTAPSSGSGTATVQASTGVVMGSAVVTVTATPPATPTSLTAKTASSSSIALSWTGSTGATSYLIERSPNGTTGWAQIGTTGSSATSYTDTGMTSSTTYYYYVMASNSAGNSPASNTASATTAAAPPAAPTNLTASTVSSNSIALSWTGSTGASSYLIERSPNGTTGWAQIGTTGSSAKSYTDTGLAASTTYYYYVVASNSAGNSPASNTASATTAAAPPAAPTGLTAKAASSSSIALSWTSSAGATGYLIERSANGSTGWTQIGSTSVTTTSYTDSGLAASTTYYFCVVASSSAGNSPASNTASAATAPNPPAAPTNLIANASASNKIALSWTGVAGATSYLVLRSLNGVSWSQIATTGTGITTYSDTGLTASTTYYYEVIAVNSGGGSPPSNVASATTTKKGK